MRHLLAAREREALGQGVGHAREFEPAEDSAEVGGKRISRRHAQSPEKSGEGGDGGGVSGADSPSGRAYWLAGRR